MKKITLLMMVVFVLMSGCFKEKSENLVIDTEKKGDVTTFIAKKDFEGVQILFENKDVEVEVSENVLLIRKEEGKSLLVSFAKTNGSVKKDEIIFKTKGTNNYIIERVITKIELGKRRRGTVENKLLGDFKQDNKVDVLDFDLFIDKFDLDSTDTNYDVNYDISPATKGLGEWANIYSNATPDGSIDLLDFVIFAKNYEKTAPNEEVTINSIEIIGENSVNIGSDIELQAKVNYSDGSNKIESATWSSSNSNATVNEYGIVTGISEGTASIEAKKDGITSTKSIIIKKAFSNGIKIHVKGYTHVWAWDAEEVNHTTSGEWPGDEMPLEDGSAEWRVITFESLSYMNLIFSNGGGGQTAELKREEQGEWWFDGAWKDTNPDIDITAPIISTDPEAGNFEETTLSVNIVLTDADTNAKAYYTINGSDPIVGTNEAIGAITLNGDTTLKVIAKDKDGNTSGVSSFVFDLDQDATPPVITSSLGAGTYATNQNTILSISDNRDSNPNIYYTVDGTTPKEELNFIYSGQSISLGEGRTYIKTLAVDNKGNKKEYKFSYYIGEKPERTDFRQETIYFAMTTRFYDGDPENNVHCWDDAQAGNPDSDPAWRGDFKGLIAKLDYLKALGFSAVWITPPVKNISGYDYHGYHASNFQEIDPRYDANGDGTAMDDYQELIDEIHARGMKIVQDVVFNHTGNFGEDNLHPLFRRNPGTVLDEDFNTAITNIAPNGMLPGDYDSLLPGEQFQARIAAMRSPLDTEHHYHNHNFKGGWEQYEVQIGSIAGDCQDLNTENPEVANYIVDSYRRYIEMGVDAFRVDTVKHISRYIFNKYLIPGLKETGGDNFFMFGEVCNLWRGGVWDHGIQALSTPFYTWNENESWPADGQDSLELNTETVEAHWDRYSGMDGVRESDNHALHGNDYHTPDYSEFSGMAVIDFPMHYSFKSASDAWSLIGDDKYYNDATWNVTYVDSHDYAPDNAPRDKRFSEGQNVWAENLSIIFTFRGIPTLYYGSEIEFAKGFPIDVGPNAPLSTTGRAYFGDHIEGSVDVTDFGEYTNATGAMKETLEHPLAQHIRSLNRIRRAVPALQMGQYSQEGISGSGYYFKRRYTKDGVDSMALVVISGSATFSGVPSGRWVDIVTGDVQNGSTVTANADGQGNVRVYVMDGEKIDGLTGKYIK